MELPGARLKKIRLEKGLSLEDVQKKTKIHLNVLRAIEEDNLTVVNPVYTKGFLKIYCQLLGVNPKDYQSGYQPSQTQNAASKGASMPQKPVSIKRRNGGLAFLRKINLKPVIKPVFFITLVIFGFFVFSGVGKFLASKRPIKQIQPRKENTNQKTPVAETARKTVSPKPAKISGRVVTKELSQPIRLGLRAKDDSWVHLSADGKVVFHAVLKKGKTESWTANNKIEFSLGNAAGIEIELNGKTIPALGRKGQSVKNVVVTREDGLVVAR